MVTASQNQRHSFVRRQGNNNATSALAFINNHITSACQQDCSFMSADIIACAQATSQAAIAACACSSQVLGDMRACSSCIASDGNTTDPNAIVRNYNTFVTLCTTDGLASVTGTVAVGGKTTSVARTSLVVAAATASTQVPTSVAGAVSIATVARTSSTAPVSAAAASTTARPSSASTLQLNAGLILLLATSSLFYLL